MISTQVQKQVQFVEGEFSPSEVKDIIGKVIDDQSNFYKLQHLSQWMKDNNCDCETIENQKKELHNQKCELTEIMKEARDKGCKVKLVGEFRLTIEE